MAVSAKIKDAGQDTSLRSKADQYWKRKGFDSKYILYRTPQIPDFKKTFEDPYSMLLQKFKFKSIEFGNWVPANWRYSYLMAASLAMYDINKVLGFDFNTGLYNTIGLAFGSRGSGKALAHFEPGTFMINLTRYQRGSDESQKLVDGGVMSLAHEYGHALDYFFASYIAGGTRSLTNGDTTDTKFRWLLDGKASVDKLHLLMHEVMKTIIFTDGSGYTNYYKILYLNSNQYWYQHNELFARAFEQYVQRKLEKAGIKNRFLTKGKYNAAVYMPERLFLKVEPHMDNLIAEMRKRLKAKR